MKLTHTSEMAIHGLWELALANEDRLLVAEIARRHNVSVTYLAKIFHRLGQAGIVSSRRGKVGGFTLARPASDISVGEIVRLFESGLEEDMAVESERQKLLQTVLDSAENRIFEVLDSVSLADLKRKSLNTEAPRLSRRKYQRKEGNV